MGDGHSLASVRSKSDLLARSLVGVDHVENDEDLLLCHAIDVGVESVEAWEDLVDEFVSSITVLQAASDTVVVHSGDEGLEFVALKKTISVGISRLEGSVDLCHEALQRLRVGLELILELLTL